MLDMEMRFEIQAYERTYKRRARHGAVAKFRRK